MNDRNETMFKCVREFQNYDLYSKSPVRPDLQELRPCYERVIAESFRSLEGDSAPFSSGLQSNVGSALL